MKAVRGLEIQRASRAGCKIPRLASRAEATVDRLQEPATGGRQRQITVWRVLVNTSPFPRPCKILSSVRGFGHHGSWLAVRTSHSSEEVDS